MHARTAAHNTHRHTRHADTHMQHGTPAGSSRHHCRQHQPRSSSMPRHACTHARWHEMHVTHPPPPTSATMHATHACMHPPPVRMCRTARGEKKRKRGGSKQSPTPAPSNPKSNASAPPSPGRGGCGTPLHSVLTPPASPRGRVVGGHTEGGPPEVSHRQLGFDRIV